MYLNNGLKQSIVDLSKYDTAFYPSEPKIKRWPSAIIKQQQEQKQVR